MDERELFDLMAKAQPKPVPENTKAETITAIVFVAFVLAVIVFLSFL